MRHDVTYTGTDYKLTATVERHDEQITSFEFHGDTEAVQMFLDDLDSYRERYYSKRPFIGSLHDLACEMMMCDGDYEPVDAFDSIDTHPLNH